MRISRITLNGFKRFNLSTTGNIDLVLDSKLVLIIGPNGAGKSSLIKELSPLPANAADFNKGGYKYIEIEYNRNTYKLTNTFEGGTGKFSFIRDEVELNPGLTVTVYKDLVYKFFNLDNTTFNLLNNETSFIHFNNQERKNWITRISDNDLTYAISFYNKSKELLRDIQGSLKLAKAKLLQETDKLIDPSEHEKLKQLISDSHLFIDKLLATRDNSYTDPLKLKTDIDQIENYIKALTDQLADQIKTYPQLTQFATIAAIDSELVNTQSEINLLSVQSQELSNKIKANLADIELLQKANINNKETTIERLAAVTEQIVATNAKLKYNLIFTNPDEALTSFSTIYDNLQDIFMNLTKDPERRYTKDYYISMLERFNKLTNQITSAEIAYKTHTAKKHELESRKKDSGVDCPKCHHSWYLNYDEHEYLSVLNIINTLYIDIEKYKEQHKQLEEEILSLKHHLGHLSNFFTITRNWIALSPAWELLTKDPDLYNNPKALIPKLTYIKEDILEHINIRNLLSTKESLDNVLVLMEKDSQLSLDELDIKHNQLESQLAKTNHDLSTLNKRLAYTKSLRSVRELIDISSDSLGKAIASYQQGMDKATSYKRRLAIDEVIRTIKLYISDKESILSKQTMQAGIVDNISKTISEQEEQLIYYKAIEKALSPTEGLIARSLTGFINTFILQINSFIKKIWSYPIELQTIIPDENLEINYKFKVTINESVHIPDISKLSSAQKEIVDLAIRIVSMKYLHMTDYPLFLDEFASKMDIVHRKAAFYTISNLLLNSNFSQIFIINHYEDQYGSLKNAQVVDLKNI